MAEVREIAPILIVDDSKEDLFLLERVLRQCKILNPVIRCASGEECVLQLGAALNRIAPAMVMLDLVMAPLSGLDILRAMKRHGYVKEVPVVMLSGIRDIQAVGEGYQLGAQTFLIKPVTAEDILQLVNGLKCFRTEPAAGGYVLHPVIDVPAGGDSDTAMFSRTSAKAFSV